MKKGILVGVYCSSAGKTRLLQQLWDQTPICCIRS